MNALMVCPSLTFKMSPEQITCPLSSKWSLFDFSFIINSSVLLQNMPEKFLLVFQSIFVVDYYITGQLRRESLNSGVFR